MLFDDKPENSRIIAYIFYLYESSWCFKILIFCAKKTFLNIENKTHRKFHNTRTSNIRILEKIVIKLIESITHKLKVLLNKKE